MQLGPHPAAAQQEFLDTLQVGHVALFLASFQRHLIHLQGGGLLALSQQGHWDVSVGPLTQWTLESHDTDIVKECGI